MKPLEQLRPKGCADVQLCLGFHPFGQHQAANGLPQQHQRFHRLLLEEVVIDAVDKTAVQLDDVGPQFGDAWQVAVARSHVVEGNQKPQLPVTLNEALEHLQVIGLGFVQLNHDVTGLKAGSPCGVEQSARTFHPLVNQGGFEVEEQQGALETRRERDVLECLHRLGATAAIQLQQTAGLSRLGKHLRHADGMGTR
jgi:hypothetical protein